MSEQVKKWTSEAGPIQTKKVNQALSAISSEGKSHTEKWGVIGLSEQESSFYSPFSPARPEAAKALEDIAAKFNWLVTRENFQDIITAATAAVLELRKTRPVKDTRVTVEADLKRKEESRQAEAEREAKEQAKAAQVAARVAELRQLYPWANTDSSVREAVRAASNLKTELSRAFPHVTFSVRADGYDAIRVHYQFGPTTKEVEALSNKYKNASFDGQSDSWNHDHSIDGDATSVVLGRVRFLSVSREFPSDTYSRVGQLMCAAKGLTFAGMEMRNITGELDSDQLSDHVFRLLHRTSFAAGAEIVGVLDQGAEREKFNEEMLAAYGVGWVNEDKRATLAPEHVAKLQAYESQDTAGVFEWCRLAFNEPKLRQPAIEPQGPTPTRTGNGITISYNAEKNGVEIKFDNKPTPEVLARLKAPSQKWRYYSPNRIWYKRYTPEVWKWAHEFAGLALTAAPTVATSEPDKFDMHVEDEMARACGC